MKEAKALEKPSLLEPPSPCVSGPPCCFSGPVEGYKSCACRATSRYRNAAVASPHRRLEQNVQEHSRQTANLLPCDRAENELMSRALTPQSCSESIVAQNLLHAYAWLSKKGPRIIVQHLFADRRQFEPAKLRNPEKGSHVFA